MYYSTLLSYTWPMLKAGLIEWSIWVRWWLSSFLVDSNSNLESTDHDTNIAIYGASSYCNTYLPMQPLQCISTCIYQCSSHFNAHTLYCGSSLEVGKQGNRWLPPHIKILREEVTGKRVKSLSCFSGQYIEMERTFRAQSSSPLPSPLSPLYPFSPLFSRPPSPLSIPSHLFSPVPPLHPFSPLFLSLPSTSESTGLITPSVSPRINKKGGGFTGCTECEIVSGRPGVCTYSIHSLDLLRLILSYF